MKLHLLAVTALLSVAHATQIVGTCTSDYKNGDARNPFLSCHLNIDGNNYSLSRSFLNRPTYPKVCADVSAGNVCVETASDDHLWISVYFNGKKVSYKDGQAQAWWSGDVRYHRQGFVGYF
jgi:hypothetical protein